eukprot:gene1956-2224_t
MLQILMLTYLTSEQTFGAQQSTSPTTSITFDQLKRTKHYRKVNVIVTLSMGDADPKTVQSAKKADVEEDCILEDATGTSEFHIWEPVIERLSNSQTYKFDNVSIRFFKGRTYLSTILSITFEETDQEVRSIESFSLLNTPVCEIDFKEIKAVPADVTRACHMTLWWHWWAKRQHSPLMLYAVANVVFFIGLSSYLEANPDEFADVFKDDWDEFGIEYDGPRAPGEDNEGGVVVPEIDLQLSVEQENHLLALRPNATDDDAYTGYYLHINQEIQDMIE